MGLGKCTGWLAQICLSAWSSENHSSDHYKMWQLYGPSHGYYLIRFWRSSVGNYYFGKLSLKLWDVFFQDQTLFWPYLRNVCVGWVGLWGFLWWAPSAKGKDHHGVSSGWSSVWHRSNTGLSSTQYEQIPIILGIWPFWLTPFFFRSITFWRAYG